MKEELQTRIVALQDKIAAGEAMGGDEVKKDRARQKEIQDAMLELRKELIPINGRLNKAEPKGLDGLRQALNMANAQMKKIEAQEVESKKLSTEIDKFMDVPFKTE